MPTWSHYLRKNASVKRHLRTEGEERATHSPTGINPFPHAVLPLVSKGGLTGHVSLV